MEAGLKERIHRNCQKIFSDMYEKRKSQPYFIIAAMGAAAFMLAIRFQLPSDLTVMILVATLLGLGWLYYSPYLHAQKVFKAILMPQIVKSVNPNFRYNPQAQFSSSILRASQVLPISYSKFQADDEFTGQVDKIHFGFRDVKLVVTKGSGKNKRTVEVFQGVIMDFSYPKNFKGHTVIHKDQVESLAGGYLAGLFQDLKQSVSNLKRVQLEHPDFEKQFLVLSNDQQEARYLITPKTMELVMAFTQEMGSNTHFSFFQNRFYIALDYPPIHFDLKHPEALDDVIARVEMVGTLIQRVADALDLDNQSYKAL